MSLILQLLLIGFSLYPFTWITRARNDFIASLEVLKLLKRSREPVPSAKRERLWASVSGLDRGSFRSLVVSYIIFMAAMAAFEIGSLFMFEKRYGFENVLDVLGAAVRLGDIRIQGVYLGYEILLHRKLMLAIMILFFTAASLLVTHFSRKKLGKLNDRCLEAIRKAISEET